jgi:hypothetical protein
MLASRFIRVSAAAAAAAGLACASTTSFGVAADASFTGSAPSCLSPAEFRDFKVAKIEALTADTKKYTIAVPSDPKLTVRSHEGSGPLGLTSTGWGSGAVG